VWAFKFSRLLDASGALIPIERDALKPGFVVSCPEFPQALFPDLVNGLCQ
jgi:hypothetical protein